MPVVFRLWASVRLAHLKEWFYSWVPDSVFSGGKGVSSVDVWYATSIDIEEVLSHTRNNDFHIFVADVVKSFDTVGRDILDDCALGRLGLPAWFRRVYFSFHREDRLRFKLAAGLGVAWTRDGGILQGCPLSMVFIVALYAPRCRHLESLVVHGDDFVVSGEAVDVVWMRNELESKLEINTTILGDEPGMSKEVKILTRKLCWHDGVGISYEADRKHAEVIIRETGASSLTSLKIPMSKENKEEVRDKTDDIVEKRKLGKLGVKEQPQLYAGNLKCTSFDVDSVLAAAQFTVPYVHAVGQEASPGKCVLLSTSKAARRRMTAWRNMNEGCFWAVKLDVWDLGGHLDVTLRAVAGTLDGRVKIATTQVPAVGALFVLFQRMLGMVRSKYAWWASWL